MRRADPRQVPAYARKEMKRRGTGIPVGSKWAELNATSKMGKGKPATQQMKKMARRISPTTVDWVGSLFMPFQ